MKDKTGILEALQNIDSGVLSPKGFKAVWDAIKPLVEDLVPIVVRGNTIVGPGELKIGDYVTTIPEQAEGAQGEREAKPGLFCRECNGRLAVRGVCSIYCPKCEKGDNDADSPGVPAEALLYRRLDKDDRAWSVTCDPHYMDFFRKADGYESKLLIDAALAQPSPEPCPCQLGNCLGAEEGQWCKAQPSPAPELERPEVVAWQYRVTAGPQTGWSLWHPGKGEEYERSYTVECRPLMTVAQHDRSVGALREEASGWKAMSIVAANGKDELRHKLEAAQARVAELEKQEPVAFKSHGAWDGLDDLSALPDGTNLYAAPVAKAGQVPDALILAEQFIAGFEDDESQEGVGALLASIRAAIGGAR